MVNDIFLYLEAELNDCKKKMEVTIQDYENLKGSIEFLSDFFFFLSLDPAKSGYYTLMLLFIYF